MKESGRQFWFEMPDWCRHSRKKEPGKLQLTGTGLQVEIEAKKDNDMKTHYLSLQMM